MTVYRWRLYRQVRSYSGPIFLMSTIKMASSRGAQSPSPVFFIFALPKRSLTSKSHFGSQAPNRASRWSERQRSKESALQGPRFTGVELAAQPSPLAAIELLKKQPATVISERTVSCDGDGLLGHPKIFINLDDSGKVKSCGYCGRRYRKDH